MKGEIIGGCRAQFIHKRDRGEEASEKEQFRRGEKGDKEWKKDHM